MTERRGYKDLIAWQKSKSLAVEVYALTRKFPVEERFGITSQFRRQAFSIPLNIAEGYRRETIKDRKHFLVMAFGSAAELEASVDICKEIPELAQFDYAKTEALLQEVIKMLYALINKNSDA